MSYISGVNFGNIHFQAFVRDPDGYYIEFCNCENLEKFLHAKMAEAEGQKLSLARTISVSSLAAKLKRISVDSKKGKIIYFNCVGGRPRLD